MIQKLKNTILAVFSLVALTTPVMIPAVASADADITNQACAGATTLEINETNKNNASAAKACPTGENGTSTINNLLATIINIFSVIVGIVAVIMIVFGAFRYITSGGDSTKVGAAKNTILYALIGLIIVALAQVIVKFVLQKSISAGA